MKAFRLAILLLLAFQIAASIGCTQKGRTRTLRIDLERIFGPSGEKLVDMAFDPEDPDMRREGISRLSRKKWGRKEPYLEKCYAPLLARDPDASVRCAAARALARAGNAEYVPNLAAALSDNSVAVRWDAAVALDRLVGEAAIEPLRTHAVRDGSLDVRTSCARALRHYHRQEVIKTLVRCLSDKAFGVRYEAHAALVALTGRDPGYEAENWAFAEGGEPKLAGPQKPGRPWWDWFGVRRKRSQGPPTAATTQPASRKRPWWDWFGISKTKTRQTDDSQ